jgi:glycosyltransferase involved in cell wall biosynthesis
MTTEYPVVRTETIRMNEERSQTKTRIIFVGAFAQRPAVHGGQLAACTSLMRSDFAEAFEIIQIDSTQVAIPPPSVLRRALSAIGRLCNFAWQAFWHRPDAALLFVADGFSFAEKGCMALFAKAAGLRVVIAPRSGFLEDHYNRYPLLRRLIRRVFRETDVIICQSQYWMDAFTRMGAEPSKCLVLKNWIDASIFTPVHDLDPNMVPLRIGFLAWVEESKGIFDLLAAVAATKHRGRKVLLEVAGSGRDLAAAEIRAQQLGIAENVRFSGWVSGPEKLRFFSEQQMLALPSYAEGLPNAMLEAMAAGRPVISTTVGSIPDVLGSSKAGMLHAPGDVNGLIAAIEFYDNDRAELAAAGRRARAVIARDHLIENASLKLQACLRGS